MCQVAWFSDLSFEEIEVTGVSCQLFRLWLGVTEYLFRKPGLLDEVINTATDDNTFRSDDLEFTFAARVSLPFITPLARNLPLPNVARLLGIPRIFFGCSDAERLVRDGRTACRLEISPRIATGLSGFKHTFHHGFPRRHGWGMR